MKHLKLKNHKSKDRIRQISKVNGKEWTINGKLRKVNRKKTKIRK